MLYLYRSNRLERLAERLAEVLAEPVGAGMLAPAGVSGPAGRGALGPALAPLVPETVVVQGPGTARWLATRIAERLGVCANVRFPLPAAFIWNCFRAVLPNLPARSPYDPGPLSWRVFALLDRVRTEPGFAALGHYLRGGDELKRFRLAGRLAATLDQYLVYRPDWIRDWEQGGGEDWQAVFWRRLVAEGGPGHWVHVHDAFLAALARSGDVSDSRCVARGRARADGEDSAARASAPWPSGGREGSDGGRGGAGGSAGASVEVGLPGDGDAALAASGILPAGALGALPGRVSVFALPTLSPSYLDLLARVAERVDVHFFLLAPSREYWSDIESPGVTARRRARWRREGRPDASGYYAVGNPLLASLGRMGRDFLDQILQYAAEEEDLWADPTGEEGLWEARPAPNAVAASGRSHAAGFMPGETSAASAAPTATVSAVPQPDAHEGVADTPERESDFHATAPGSMLRLVQRDILELRDRGREPGAPALTVSAADRSLQVHACHGPVREVQVLHDALLDLFERLPGLEPREVLVLTPDPDVYAPHVEAVFGAAPPERHIPWAVARHDAAAGDPAAAVVLQLLDLPASRLPASEVLALLEVPAVARRLQVDEAGVETLRGWVREAGIRWGVDAAARAEADLPAVDETTWAFGLRRLFLGYAMPDDEGLFAGVLPCPGPEGSAAVWLGALASLVERLAGWRRRLAGRYPAARWAALLGELVDDFLAPDDDEEDARLLELREAAVAVAEEAGPAGHLGPIGREVFRERLSEVLAGRRGAPPLLAGGVTFAGLGQLPGVPARVIWVLGMNGADFPRAHHPPGFDLTARRPRQGDRSRRDEDRQRFLDALLAARDVFAVSYVGRSARDNSRMVPSVVVSELLDYLEQACVVGSPPSRNGQLDAHGRAADTPEHESGEHLAACGSSPGTERPPRRRTGKAQRCPSGGAGLSAWASGSRPLPILRLTDSHATREAAAATTSAGTVPATDAARGAAASPASTDADVVRALVVTEHPLQPFSRRYFDGRDPRLFSFAREWIASPTITPGGFAGAPLPLADDAGREIDLAALERFLENPARHFLRERLGVRLEEGEGTPEDAEAFRLDRLVAYRLRGQALAAALAGADSEQAVLPLALARGDLPLGPVGKLDLARETANVPGFAEALRPALAGMLPALEVDVTLAGFRLCGWLTGVTPAGLVTYRATVVKARDRLRLWVRHLALCALAPAGVTLASRHFGEDGTFTLGPLAGPQGALLALVRMYRDGLAAPLPFFPETSLAWARAARQGLAGDLCWQKARARWHDDFRGLGEALDPYVAVAFRDWQPPDAAFEAAAQAVLGPLLDVAGEEGGHAPA